MTSGRAAGISDSETFERLCHFVSENHRISPMPQQWAKLCELLPGTHRVGLGDEPAAPLILVGWDTPALLKAIRFREHIEWAQKRGAIEAVDAFLGSLPEEQWYHAGD
jgi:hypothetical protein